MRKEEAIAKAIYEGRNGAACKFWKLITEAHKAPYLADARAAIAAADKWDAEERAVAISPSDKSALYDCRNPNHGRSGGLRCPPISPGLDSAIQDELDHPPASIMKEGK